MKANKLPDMIPNWINGQECAAVSQETFDKLSPDTGRKLCDVARSGSQDVQNAIQAARNAQAAWAGLTPVQRGDALHDIAQAMRKYQKELAAIVALETGMSSNAALGEVGGAIAQWPLGIVSDRIGRRPLLIAIPLAGATVGAVAGYALAAILGVAVGAAMTAISMSSSVSCKSIKKVPNHELCLTIRGLNRWPFTGRGY